MKMFTLLYVLYIDVHKKLLDLIEHCKFFLDTKCVVMLFPFKDFFMCKLWVDIPQVHKLELKSCKFKIIWDVIKRNDDWIRKNSNFILLLVLVTFFLFEIRQKQKYKYYIKMFGVYSIFHIWCICISVSVYFVWHFKFYFIKAFQGCFGPELHYRI